MIAGMLWALLAILALVFIVFALMIAALASSRRVYRQEQIKLSGLRMSTHAAFKSTNIKHTTAREVE